MLGCECVPFREFSGLNILCSVEARLGVQVDNDHWVKPAPDYTVGMLDHSMAHGNSD